MKKKRSTKKSWYSVLRWGPAHVGSVLRGETSEGGRIISEERLQRDGMVSLMLFSLGHPAPASLPLSSGAELEVPSNGVSWAWAKNHAQDLAKVGQDQWLPHLLWDEGELETTACWFITLFFCFPFNKLFFLPSGFFAYEKGNHFHNEQKDNVSSFAKILWWCLSWCYCLFRNHSLPPHSMWIKY